MKWVCNLSSKQHEIYSQLLLEAVETYNKIIDFSLDYYKTKKALPNNKHVLQYLCRSGIDIRSSHIHGVVEKYINNFLVYKTSRLQHLTEQNIPVKFTGTIFFVDGHLFIPEFIEPFPCETQFKIVMYPRTVYLQTIGNKVYCVLKR